MLKDYAILAVTSVAVFLALAFSVAKDIVPEYAKYQKKYYELNKMPDVPVAINQINVKIGDSVLIDRCTTCHVGASDPKAAKYDLVMRTHPNIVPGTKKDPHNYNELGCVACHDGNGRALSTEDAHGKFHDWYAPLLIGKYVQASCSRCHDTNKEDLAGADVLNHGRKLFIEKACWVCHTIDGISEGKVGPVLTNVGVLFTKEYLIESLVHPKANTESSKMPKFNWTSDKKLVQALVVYLKSQRSVQYRSADKAPLDYQAKTINYLKPKVASVSHGRKLFMGKAEMPIKGGCINCHSVREADGKLFGGTNGPELTYAARARSKEYITGHIINPRKDVMDSIMPPFTKLNKVEVESLYLYLSSLNYKNAAVKTGKEVFTQYCASCHGDKLDGKGYLHELIDPLPRNLSRTQFVATYHQRFEHSIENGVPGTAMPPWKAILSKKQIKDVIDYIKDVSGIKKSGYKRYDVTLPKVGDKERRSIGKAKKIIKADAKRGEVAYQKFCTSCHGKLANGKGPNAYNLELPMPRNLLNKNYFKQYGMSTERLYKSILLGVSGTPMPAHDFLKDQTILDIVAYIESLHK